MNAESSITKIKSILSQVSVLPNTPICGKTFDAMNQRSFTTADISAISFEFNDNEYVYHEEQDIFVIHFNIEHFSVACTNYEVNNYKNYLCKLCLYIRNKVEQNIEFHFYNKNEQGHFTYLAITNGNITEDHGSFDILFVGKKKIKKSAYKFCVYPKRKLKPLWIALFSVCIAIILFFTYILGWGAGHDSGYDTGYFMASYDISDDAEKDYDNGYKEGYKKGKDLGYYEGKNYALDSIENVIIQKIIDAEDLYGIHPVDAFTILSDYLTGESNDWNQAADAYDTLIRYYNSILGFAEYPDNYIK